MAPSKVWNSYVKVDSTSARCKACGAVVKSSGNTVNLWNHLKRRHNVSSPGDAKPKKGKVSANRSDGNNEEAIDDPDVIDVEGDDARSDGTLTPMSPTPSASISSSSSGCITGAGSTSLPKGNLERNFKSPTQTRNPWDRSPFSGFKTQTLEESFDRAKSFSPTGYKTSELNEALMYMVVQDGLPLNTVEKPGFRCFAKKAVPLYNVPSKTTFTRMIDAKYDILKDRVRSIFTATNAFNLTADIWTDTFTTQSYLGVTVHVLKDCHMTSANIGVTPLNESHGSEYISKVFENVCAEWNIPISKVKNVVTDNAPNIVAAAKKTFGPTKHLGCFAHTLNLVVEKAIDTTPELSPLITKVKSIVTFTKHSVAASDQLKSIQLKNGCPEGKVLKLIQSVPTRWNSIFLMCERFIELSDIVGTVLLKHQNVDMLTGAELSKLKDVSRALKPAYSATVELSAEKCTTASKIIPMMNLMRTLLERMNFNDGSSPVAGVLRDKLIQQIDRRFGSMELVDTFAIATLLDPRFKKLHFRDPVAASKAITKISKMVIAQQTERIAEETPQPVEDSIDPDNMWALHEELAANSNSRNEFDTPGGIPTQLRLFLNSPLHSRDSDPLSSWETLKLAFPDLYVIAQDYLSRLVTSLPSERLFSKAGLIATELRSRLTKKRLSSLLFLSSLDEETFFIHCRL